MSEWQSIIKSKKKVENKLKSNIGAPTFDLKTCKIAWLKIKSKTNEKYNSQMQDEVFLLD